MRIKKLLGKKVCVRPYNPELSFDIHFVKTKELVAPNTLPKAKK